MTRYIAVATLLVLAAHLPAAAQIRGRVVNGATKAPIPMATVYVTDSGPSGAEAHASTDGEGVFTIQALAPGRYRVRIVAIGYAPRVLPSVEIGPGTSGD